MLASYDAASVARLARETGLSGVTTSVLLSRGVMTREEVQRFLAPSLDRDWVPTGAIPGMDGAAGRVARAVRTGERIVVFGDFDLDGISAAAVATLGLGAFGGEVTAVVPDRFREGYGLTAAALERVTALAPSLVVTVDCGISSAAEVNWLRHRGIDVVVTDHHEPGEAVPAGIPVANPKLDAAGPPLAGAGVALALVRAVGDLIGRADVWETLTDLAALGTIADIVPLQGANRALVAEGLQRLRERPRVGVDALAGAAGVTLGTLRAHQVAFSLAPRLNAAGRMASPELALELLMTDDAARAGELAATLDGLNRERQAVEAALLEEALARVEESFQPGDRVIVVAGEGWHDGVRGIVASRLVSRFGVPALVFCIEGDEAQGSGRSVPGVDLHGALTALSPLLTRYGGHEMAVGVTLPARELSLLRDRLRGAFAALPEAAFVSRITIDADVELDSLSRELATELSLLEPFGCGNPRPLLAATGVFMTRRALVGRANEHLSFSAYDGVASVPGIAFRQPDAAFLSEHEAAVDLAFELELAEWRGVERVRLLARDIRLRVAPEGAPARELVEDLFEHAEEILARGEYDGIEDAESFYTKLAGVTFDGRQQLVKRLVPGAPLRLEREPDNRYDSHACALHDPYGDRIGYLNRRLAGVLAPLIDSGIGYDVEVADVTGGGEGESLGVNVLVTRRGDADADGEQAARIAERRAELDTLNTDALTATLVRHFIGDRLPHAAQAEALKHLAAGRSTLLVMATGRGKSLVFHVHAAREAIRNNRASIFVYPLRALVADQAFHLEERLTGIGCTVTTLTGESPPGRRDEVFAALASGTVDVVLTTPEFLERHTGRFAETGRVSFVVVDEAHHAGQASAGHRPAYGRLGETIASLRGSGDAPLVLAATATAPDGVVEALREGLGVTAEVIDVTVRENLRIADRRGAADKDALIAALAARGEKTIVYVNSRERTVKLARTLRARVPALLHHVAFYNASMTRDARHAVERAFHDGEITIVVATTAFGEGVNIPDVRHVVLYHLPMGEIEFNQLCGRGGRDGAPADVHLLFGEKDAKLNRMILGAQAPARDDLAALYLVLRDLAVDGDGSFEITNAELAERANKRRPAARLTENGVSSGLSVFRELGLVRSEGFGSYRQLGVLPAPERKLDLTASVRYAEGLRERALFEAFLGCVLSSTADELLRSFNRPILPSRLNDRATPSIPERP